MLKDAREQFGLCFEQSYSGRDISEKSLEISRSKYKSGCLRSKDDSLKCDPASIGHVLRVVSTEIKMILMPEKRENARLQE